MTSGGNPTVRFDRRAPEQTERVGPNVGDVLEDGRYVLLERIGEGGMGTVFLADDRRRERKVAVKTLIPRYVGRPEREQRLFDELDYLKRVQDHRHVAAAIEGGRLREFDGWPFLVMEYITGRSLFSRFLQDEPMTAVETVDVALQVARGLEAIHSARVVHRDVTPQNILLVDDGGRATAKIIDFSHAADADGPRLQLGDDRRLTRMFEVPGTAGYMPPEQAFAVAADTNMDVYAFGVVLYEMVTGRNPFGILDREVYIDLQRHEALHIDAIDPRAHPEIPPSFFGLVESCTETRSHRRPPIAEIVRRLEAIAVEVAPPVGAPALRVVDTSAVDDPRLVPVPADEGGLGVERVDDDDATVEGPSTVVVVVVAMVVVVVTLAVAWLLWPGNDEAEGSGAVVEPAQGPTPSPSEPLAAAEDPGVGPEVVVPEVSPEPAVELAKAPDLEPAPEPAPEPGLVEPSHPENESGTSEPANASTKPMGRRAKRPPAKPAVASDPKPPGPDCEKVVAAANAAWKGRGWAELLQHTSQRVCWTDAPIDRLVLRAEALTELGRWNECARLGEQSNDPRVQRWTERCRVRLDRLEDAP